MKRPTLRSRRLATGLLVGASFTTPIVMAPTSVAHAEAPAVVGLHQGDRGQAVRAVQQALVDAGFTPDGGVDGIFGDGTKRALVEFQKKNGLSASGTVDGPTAAALGLNSSSGGSDSSAASSDVELVQRVMLKYGYTVRGGADGNFGPNTERPLRVFQAHNGLTVSGQVDGPTVALAKSLLGDPASGSQEPANGTTTTTPQTPTGGASSAAPAQAAQFIGVRLGARGAKVQRVQQRLIDAGYEVVGGADGIFGALTARAVKQFQSDAGLLADGIVGPRTSAALAKLGVGQKPQGAAPTTPKSPLVGLAYGSTGGNVRTAQQALIAAGYSPRGGADGVFGTATRKALREFQARNGLQVTGNVDSATAAALEAVGSKPKAPAAEAPNNAPIVGLKAGSLGSLVKQLQQALIDAGVTVRGGADGIFGPATDKALRAFQTSQGLDATGVVNQATFDALANPKPVVSSTGPGTAAGYAVFGERGERVRSLQQALINAGMNPRGGADGNFGAGTASSVMNFQRAKGLPVTGKVDAKTAAALGLEAMDAGAVEAPTTAVVLEAFPVQGWCGFADTWHAPRSGGRLHVGADIIAAEGKLLYAVADGTIEKVYYDRPGSLAGNGVRLRMDNGTYFFYAHMVGIADGIDQGVRVKAGQIIGAVGSTGNAGTAHLHFEIHPGGGAPVNPYQYLKAVDGCSNRQPLPQP